MREGGFARRLHKSDAGDYLYGAKPHAVAQVSGAVNATYTYDANGNLIGGAGRSVTTTSYNLPSQITQGGSSVNFIYDADHTRIKQVTSSETMIYLNPRIDLGGHFEKEIKGGVTEYKHYIYGGAGVVAIYTTRSGAIPTTRYLHQDHLGSIVAVTNESGGVVARYAYDAWGKRIPLAGDAEATHHGFTGHEHLEGVGLIHMNGRVYDPVLARFMSADPYIQAPGNLQSYNRYSYVWNNPLASTDPSGYFKLGGLLRTVVAAVASYYTFGYTAILSGSYVAAGAAAGFVGGAIQSGNLQGGVNGAITGALTAGLSGAVGGQAGSFNQVAAHAASGCVGSVIGGGKCGQGALSAGFAEFAGPKFMTNNVAANAVTRATIGGVASVLGGGKFENGAWTAAMSYLFTTGYESLRSPRVGALEIKYFNSFEERANYLVGAEPYTGDFNGSKEGVELGFSLYGESPEGAKILATSAEIGIVYHTGEPYTEGNVIYWDGYPRNPSRGFQSVDRIVNHEIGHTPIGGHYADTTHPDHKDFTRLGNVARENIYLRWRGYDERTGYLYKGGCYAPSGQPGGVCK